MTTRRKLSVLILAANFLIDSAFTCEKEEVYKDKTLATNAVVPLYDGEVDVDQLMEEFDKSLASIEKSLEELKSTLNTNTQTYEEIREIIERLGVDKSQLSYSSPKPRIKKVTQVININNFKPFSQRKPSRVVQVVKKSAKEERYCCGFFGNIF